VTLTPTSRAGFGPILRLVEANRLLPDVLAALESLQHLRRLLRLVEASRHLPDVLATLESLQHLRRLLRLVEASRHLPDVLAALESLQHLRRLLRLGRAKDLSKRSSDPEFGDRTLTLYHRAGALVVIRTLAVRANHCES